MGDLAAGLAHEISQPLTAILNYARAGVRMADAGAPDLPLLCQTLGHIAQQSDRAADVIRRLRRYIEQGQIERQPNDLSACVQEVMDLLDHDLKAHHVRIGWSAPPDGAVALIDRIQIEKVLVNLLRNAVEAMIQAQSPEPAIDLHLAASDAPAGYCVSVRDNGPGFGSTAADQLFAPFFTTKKDGMGQGLSICRRIAEAHGGRIWAEANTPRGAAFHLWLPAGTSGSDGRDAA